MPLVDHLLEARQRIVYAFIGLIIASVIGWFLYPMVFDYMAQPLTDLRTEGKEAQLNFETVSAAFDLKLRISFFIGLLISSPWWLYQIWAYLAPALRRNEKIYALAFTLSGVLLFSLGAASGVWIMPHAVHILTSFAPDTSVMLMKSGTYFSFYMRLVILFGVSFLIPLVMVALNFLNVLRASTMLKAWRWAVVLSFIFAAIANPLPDPWTMTVQALLLCSLYFLAIGVSAIHDRRYDRKQARIEAELDAALARNRNSGDIDPA